MKSINDYYGVPAPLLVIDGDSQSTSFGLSAGQDYPTLLLGLLGGVWAMRNYAVPGQLISAMSADAAAEIDPNYRASRGSGNVLLAWGGNNGLSASTAESIYADYVAYCAARRAAGWKVVVFTVTPTQSAAATADREPRRITYNGLVRANWRTLGHAFVDAGAAPHLANYEDALDPIYFQAADTLHLTLVGKEIVAALAKTAVLTL